jgi:hypothetical protein
MTSLCGGGGRWYRLVRHCPVCKRKRRTLTRIVYSGYGSDGVCGGCGSWFSDGTQAWTNVAIRTKNREMVAREWPTAGKRAEMAEEFRRMLEEKC